ncbi:MAG: type IIL restriction-modification enzyme MmeI, partial [Thermoguttaceae bacterium]
AEEFINNGRRFCIWLKGVSPHEYRGFKPIVERVEAVRRARLASKRAGTRELAKTATEFAFISHPDKPYLLIPSVSSEKRDYIPMGFMSAKVIASNACLIIPDATLYEFGVLTSTMHMAWTRYVCGRLEMRYRYSASIVYNNFPWCEPTDKQRSAIEDAAQGVLDARAEFAESSLADLYDPNTMPRVLLKSHEKLDRAVEKAYGRTFTDDAARVAFLFERYQSLTADLISEPAKRKRKTAKRPKSG